ncbi:DUF2975 domain-containing protein [Sandaracinobacteroides hominis]|uniref:DUF2975 domain-containing protein n=1 Tax=Sandaracinobacteroides hominis TaxID=2780086 RepID=UPI0018F3F841|nr:DUF2975 domain-containing protein [Sandaracinobacteroides hominis]
MPDRTTIPLKVSSFLVKAGHLLTALLSIGLLVVAILLAIAWPTVLSEAIEQGAKAKIADIQPWTSLVLLGASLMLYLAARMFGRLGTVLDSVSSGDPFTADNSRRLRHIGWLMIAIQLVGGIVGWIGMKLPTGNDISTGFDLNFSGILAALLAFVVAQLFEKAAAMREELEGTV